ncbi:hypothetical protein AAL_01161 [Moelleriella libera RCEF 2490]|uniref:DnaJ homologue subfamily C member 28 conserved domain-containing protein n=1 Tax=Moelleriella libera RCEF 2490 TaxID=1081109 RepID=A0A166VIB1_9HYPO|nr:hypothetical protein AAL_01161 [Moelleriella libera RCEF 2490]
MTRRLEEATEETLLNDGLSGRRAVEDAGFSEELKQKLLGRIADSQFEQQYSGAFSQAGFKLSQTSSGPQRPSSSQSGQPWTGTESTENAVLRMLNDARKPLKPQDRGKFQPPVVDTRIRRSTPRSPGQIAANARERANLYVGMDLKTAKGLSEEEKEEMKAELRERFQPAARAVPASISGLTALANQRIEDAIARGQFKDLPRGQQTERDPRADNPFIDTTEYIMNKMIQRQEIVPPWIEKQQELSKALRVFRERLRNDWKRHAARMIAARGGSLAQQMGRAAAYAAAERQHNPRYQNVKGQSNPVDATIEMTEASSARGSGESESSSFDTSEVHNVQRPFRDPDWEQAERSYMNLSVETINNITRSYNLMAPELAKKPYHSLERELNSCFADVAPLVANEIKARAVGRIGTSTIQTVRPERPKLLEKLIGKDNVKIHLEAEEKAYGLKEWWRDFRRGKL